MTKQSSVWGTQGHMDFNKTPHGPVVGSTKGADKQMQMFEMMQNISDIMTNKTEFDDYVD